MTFSRPDRVHCYTSVTFAYLDRARVLAYSVRAMHPDWRIWLVLSDRPPPAFTFEPDQEPFDEVLHVEDLAPDDRERWIFAHDLVELCTAVKGPALCHILSAGADAVVYLDPDTVLINPLDPVLDALTRADVALTPHLLDPQHDPMAPNERDALRYGVYNLGFLAVAARRHGLRFAAWWRERLLGHCVDDPADGLFTDQKWIDLVPGLFPAVAILRDPGLNVASWNLDTRPIRFTSDGQLTAAGSVLRFLHFTKITQIGARAYFERDEPVLVELGEWYLRELRLRQVEGLPSGWWYYGHYADGSPIELRHRRRYRASRVLQDRFPHPFSSGPSSYQAWIAENPHER